MWLAGKTRTLCSWARVPDRTCAPGWEWAAGKALVSEQEIQISGDRGWTVVYEMKREPERVRAPVIWTPAMVSLEVPERTCAAEMTCVPEKEMQVSDGTFFPVPEGTWDPESMLGGSAKTCAPGWLCSFAVMEWAAQKCVSRSIQA